jgi:hypothetical protein
MAVHGCDALCGILQLLTRGKAYAHDTNVSDTDVSDTMVSDQESQLHVHAATYADL